MYYDSLWSNYIFEIDMDKLALYQESIKTKLERNCELREWIWETE